MSRLFIIHIKYDLDGKELDHNSEIPPFVGAGDGCETCWGYGITMKSEKLFIGFDMQGLSIFYMDDVYKDNESIQQYWYTFNFLNKGFGLCNDTIYVHLSHNDKGKLCGIIESNNAERIELKDDGEYTMCELFY